MLPKGLLKEHSQFFTTMMRIIDTGIILLASWLAYRIRFGTLQMPRAYWSALGVAALATLVIFSSLNIYTSKRSESFSKHMLSLLQAIFILTFVLAGMAFYTKSGDVFSRVWFIEWMVCAFVLLMMARASLLIFLRFMRAKGWNERRVIIFGAGELGAKLANTIQVSLWTGFKIVAFLDDNALEKPSHLQGIPVYTTPANFPDYLLTQNIDELWIALPLRNEARVKEILLTLRQRPINTRFVLDIFGLDLLNHSLIDLAGFPVLNICSTPMVGINRVIKALEDRILAAFILMLISPLLAIIAIGVKLTSKGPIIFKQKRLGWDNKIITVYKFRTMFLHQEKMGYVTQATLADKRITPFGKWLRRLSLDELPQFINVLQGRMSIVGPRPHALAHNEIYKEAITTYMHRHRVKPGITGWAQIHGWRGETDTLDKMQKRVEYDLYYINNWSLIFDLKIIFLTIFNGFSHRNAW